MNHETVISVLLLFSLLIFVYFVCISIIYSLNIFKAFFNVRTSMKVVSSDIDLESEKLLPISILVPAYNESATIVESIESLLRSDYPVFEIVVVNDGSKDDTLKKLVEYFGLSQLPITFSQQLPCNTIHNIYTDLKQHKITVVDKENGGKADSLNAAINLSRYPYICCIDADCMLEKQALKNISRHFARQKNSVAVGGIVRIANGCTIENGEMIKPDLPHTMIEKIQILEYLRAFFTNRFSKNKSNNMLIISGAFGMFRKSAVLQVGGYKKGLGEDMELVVRMHEFFRRNKLPYSVTMASDAVCWTQAPSRYKDLKTQRIRWHRGLITTLFEYRKMLFNPRYGKVGMLAYPQQLFMEMIGPLVEFVGYILFVLLLFYFQLTAAAFYIFLMAYLCGVLQTLFAVIFERFTFNKYHSTKNTCRLVLVCFAEPLFYRPVTVVWRLIASLPYKKGEHKWGNIQRKSF